MDYLEEIISSMAESEKKEFQYFIQRNRIKKNRKDLLLFQAFCDSSNKNHKSKTALFDNRNAYHSMRKKLYRHLSDYLLIKSLDEDETASSRMNSLYTNSKHLFDRDIPGVAWKVLKRAEKLGVSNELFEQLNSVYLLQIDKFHLQDETGLSEIIDRYEKNQEWLKQSEKIIVYQGLLRERVLSFKKQGAEIDFEDVFDQTLNDIEIKRLSVESPKILFDLLSTLRQWVIASKEFHTFEPIIEKSFQKLTNKSNHFYNVQLLYMLAHTKYRTKKFQESLNCVGQLNDEVTSTSIRFQKIMHNRTEMLKAANLTFLGQISESITILERLLEQNLLNPEQKSNVLINLGIYHFYKLDYHKSNRLLNSFEHSEKWYKHHMGIEWLMKRDLMTILLYYDMGEPELVESKIRSVERKYAELFKIKTYNRAKTFLMFIKSYILNDSLIDLAKLESKIEVSWDWIPKNEENLQAMLFYGWLRSKIERKGFYETVLNMISGDMSMPLEH